MNRGDDCSIDFFAPIKYNATTCSLSSLLYLDSIFLYSSVACLYTFDIVIFMFSSINIGRVYAMMNYRYTPVNVHLS